MNRKRLLLSGSSVDNYYFCLLTFPPCECLSNMSFVSVVTSCLTQINQQITEIQDSSLKEVLLQHELFLKNNSSSLCVVSDVNLQKKGVFLFLTKVNQCCLLVFVGAFRVDSLFKKELMSNSFKMIVMSVFVG